MKRLTATSRTRLELRNWNRRHVTELDEILQPLPRLDYGELPRDAPSTGRMVQRLDRRSFLPGRVRPPSSVESH